MNTSPFVDSCKSSQEIWEEFSLSFTPAVQEVVDFAKRIPGFRDLPENDQVGLLKAGTFEVSRRNPTPLTHPEKSLCFVLKPVLKPPLLSLAGANGSLRLPVQHGGADGNLPEWEAL